MRTIEIFKDNEMLLHGQATHAGYALLSDLLQSNGLTVRTSNDLPKGSDSDIDKPDYMNAIMQVESVDREKGIIIYTSTRGDIHLVVSMETIHDRSKFVDEYYFNKLATNNGEVTRLLGLLQVIEENKQNQKWFFRRLCTNVSFL